MMRLTVSDLKKRYQNKIGINDTVRDIVKMCEDSIENAYNNNQIDCTVEISDIFDIDGMSNKKATLWIHSNILQEMESRGFHVRIQPDVRQWTFSGWSIEIDDALERRLCNLLASRTAPEFRGLLKTTKKKINADKKSE